MSSLYEKRNFQIFLQESHLFRPTLAHELPSPRRYSTATEHFYEQLKTTESRKAFLNLPGN
jgi:hypothetical protein